MREYLFCGKRVDNDEWVEGYFGIFKGVPQIYVPFTEEEEKENEGHIFSCIGGVWYTVIPETVGQYTGMNEFVVSDRSFNRPLFEGNIVEVWGMRCPKYTFNPKSQYDGWMKVRAVVCFKNGEWTLDYENKYNNILTQLQGKEEDTREITGEWSLYRHQCRNEDEDWYREHNAHYKLRDIIKIGNIFENADLLEG